MHAHIHPDMDKSLVATSFVTAESKEQPNKYLPTEEWLNNLVYVHATE